MLIVCPTCASDYTIAVDRIGPTGRVVRCAACRGAWFVPPVETASETGDGASVPEALRPDEAPIRRRPAIIRRRAASAEARGNRAALALLACLILAIGVAVMLRGALVRAVPQSAAAFAILGFPVNLVGLQLGQVTSELVDETGSRVLVISGEIVNEGSRTLPIAPLALTIESETGDLLYEWTDRTARGELGAHDTRKFSVRLRTPPPEGRRVLVTFSTAPVAPAVASR